VEDGRCKLGVAGRLQLIRLIESGCSLRAAAAQSSVSPATAHRWWHRWQQATAAERASRACLRARAPVPRSCPWRLDEAAERQIVQARRRTNLGPARLAGIVGYRRSTIYKVLRRHGCSRRRRSPRPAVTRRYEWAEPGALLHMDAKQLPVFDRPGHWVDGNRTLRQDRRPVGSRRIQFAHVVVDDRTRLAYVEIHPHDRGQIAAAVLTRAARWMAEQGCGPAQAVMTDNAFAYRHSHTFKTALGQLGARHIRTPPRTPRWNGKAERFIRTLDEEWAHGRVWPNSTRRNRALASFLRYYNRRRPHTSLGDRPPISRVHQDRGQNS
jgi:transposase InsO family protein